MNTLHHNSEPTCDWSLFFDIDGTLVSFLTHEIPASTVEALTEAKRRGCRIFISTGRPVQIITNLGAIDHLIDGYVTVNGAYCFANGQEIACHAIPPADVATLTADALREDYSCMVVGERDFAVLNHHDVVDQVFVRELAVNGINFQLDAREVLRTQRILQLSPFFDERYEAAMMPRIPHCVSGRWHPLFTDITSQESDKGKGLHAMAKALGLNTAHVMAFGDGGNDLSIVREAAVGVAMGNALPSLKEAADYVTTSVDDHGVRNALIHYGLIDAHQVL